MGYIKIIHTWTIKSIYNYSTLNEYPQKLNKASMQHGKDLPSQLEKFKNGHLHACILSPQKLHRSTGSRWHQTTFRQFIHTHYPARPPRPISTPYPNQPANGRINGLRVGLTWTAHILNTNYQISKTNLNPQFIITLKSQPPEKYLRWTNDISL